MQDTWDEFGALPESIMQYDTFQHLLSYLLQRCKIYLAVPVVPFFVEVREFQTKLLKINQKIIESGSISNLDEEIKDLRSYVLNDFGVLCVESLCCEDVMNT